MKGEVNGSRMREVVSITHLATKVPVILVRGSKCVLALVLVGVRLAMKPLVYRCDAGVNLLPKQRWVSPETGYAIPAVVWLDLTLHCGLTC